LIRNINVLWTATLLALVALSSQSTLAGDGNSVDQGAVVALVNRVGISAAKAWLDSEHRALPVSDLPADEETALASKALTKYGEIRKAFGTGFRGEGDSDVGFADIFGPEGLYEAPGGSMTVPFALLSANSTISLKVLNREIDQAANDLGAALLFRIKTVLIQKAGVANFAALAENPTLLAKTIRTSDLVLRQIKDRAAADGDPAVLDLAVDILTEVAAKQPAIALAGATLSDKSPEEINQRFSNLVGDLRDSQMRIAKALDEYTKLLTEINANVADFGTQLHRVDSLLSGLGSNEAIVSDFVFSDMSLQEKVAALNAGALDERINCPQGANNCNPQEIEQALVTRYSTELAMQGRIQDAIKLATDVYRLSIVTDQLGIDNANTRLAASIASVTTGNFAVTASEDLVGTLASESELLGRRQSPDVAHFRVLVGYLQSQFREIDASLSDISDTQRNIRVSTAALSDVLRANVRGGDNQLGAVQAEQLQSSVDLKQLIWADWQSCYSVYRRALQINPATGTAFVSPNTLLFGAFADIEPVVASHGGTFKTCLTTVQSAMAGLTTQWFGAFIDARRSLSPGRIPDDVSLSAALKDEKNRWRSVSEVQIETVDQPTLVANVAWASRESIDLGTLFYLQAMPAMTTDDLSRMIVQLKAGTTFSCSSASERQKRLVGGLLCADSSGANNAASSLMAFPVNTEIMLDIADWMLVASQISDVYDQVNDRFILGLTELAAITDASPSRDILDKSIDMLSLGIDYESRLYGGLTAQAVFDDVTTPPNGVDYSPLLRNNSYLAQNVALLALKKNLQLVDSLHASANVPSLADTYAQALSYSRVDAPDRYEPLYTLFGRSYTFGETPTGAPGMTFGLGASSVVIPLPEPEQFVEGAFVYPERFYRLLAKRDQLVDRLLNYQIVDLTDRELAVIALQRGP